MKACKRSLLLTALAISSFFLIFTGCSKDEDEEKPPSDVIVAENAKFIDQNTWQGSFISVDSAIWTYLFNTNILTMNFKEGDIMVSSIGEGALRKINKITSNGNQVEFKTTGASLTDIFKQARITVSKALTLSQVRSVTYYYPGIVLDTSGIRQGTATTFNWDINVNLTDYIKLTGNFGCDWEIIFDCDIGLISGIKEVKCGFKSTEELNLKLTAGHEYNLEKSMKLASVNFSPIFIFVGPFIVVITPVLDLNLGIEGYANATVTTSVEQSLSFDAGMHYLAGTGWNNYKEFNKSFDFQPPQLNMNAGATGYLKPELILKIYGVGGPYANLKLYGRIDADLFKTPWWELYGGLKMDAGVKAEIFGEKLFDYNVPDIIKYELLIAQADSNLLTVTTSTVTDITDSSAVCGGMVIKEGTSAVTQRGVCWNTSESPEIDNAHSNDGTGMGQFTSILAGLAPNTPYFVRAYAINLTDTAYGSQVTFTTKNKPGIPCPGIPTVVYQGQTYHTVLIGSQCWLKENLNVGTLITSQSSQTNNGIVEKYCYQNNEAYCDTYGGLYKWDEMMKYDTSPGSKGICPDGWHLPTDSEWGTLLWYVGGSMGPSIAGGMLKEIGFTHWNPPNFGASDSYGFTALPAGQCCYGETFWYLGDYAFFWTSTTWYNSNLNALRYQATYHDDMMERLDVMKTDAFSVRCIKD
jgi:uncharacterized protein (TIGR02145 family)